MFKKIALISFAVIAGLLLLVTAAGIAALFYFQSAHGTRQLQALINQQIPGHLAWNETRFSPIKGQLTITKCTLLSPDKEPVARFEKLYVHLDLPALINRELVIREFRLDRPVVSVTEDQNSTLNLLTAVTTPVADEEIPPPGSSPDKAFVLPFNIIVRQLVLTGGTLVYHSIPQDQNLTLTNLSLNGQANLDRQVMGLMLTLDTAQIHLPQDREITLENISIQGKGNLENQAVSLSMTMETAAIEMAGTLKATLRNITVNGKGDLENQMASLAMTMETAVAGMAGTLDTTLHNIALNTQGRLAEHAADIALTMDRALIRFADGRRTAIAPLSLSTTFIKDALSNVDLHLVSNAGTLDLTGRADDLFSNPRTDLELTLDSEIASALSMVPATGVDAGGRLLARATLKGALTNPEASVSLDLPGGHLFDQKIRQASIDVTLTDRVCNIKKLQLEHADGKIEGTGSVNLSRAFPDGFLAPAKNMAAVEWDLALNGRDIFPGTILETFGVRGISGTGQFDLAFSGSPGAPPQGRLTLQAVDAAYAPYPPAGIDIQVGLENGTATIDHCRITALSTDLHLTGEVSILEPDRLAPLDNPSANLILETTPLSLSRLTPYIPALETLDLQGKVSLTAALNGSREAPGGRVTVLGQAIGIAGETLEQVDLFARLEDDRIYLDTLTVHLGDERKLTAAGWADTDRQFALGLDAEGIPLSRIRHIREQMPLAGLFSCHLQGEGSLEDPRLQGKIALENIEVGGKAIEDFTATIRVIDQYATVDGRFNFDVSAGLNLSTRAFTGRATFRQTPLMPWFQVAGRSDVDGILTGEITLAGNADQPEAVEMKAAVNQLSLAFQDTFNLSATDINASLRGRAFELAPFKTMLPGQGHLTLGASGAVGGTMEIAADGRIPARTALLFTDTLTDPEGDITLNATARIHPEFSRSAVDARITFNELGMKIPDTQSSLHGINGSIQADMDTVTIKEITGFVDQGSFSISGRSTLKDFMPRSYSASLTATALPVTVPEGLEALFDLDLSLEGTTEKSVLMGTILLDSGALTREIDLNKKIISAVISPTRSRKGVTTASAPSPYLGNMDLDVYIQARSNFIIDTNVVSMEIHPDIRIQGSPLEPVVSGRSTIDNGTIQHFNKTFVLNQGTIDFINPYKIEPEINIQALHRVRQWDILLAVSGIPDELIFSLDSQPRLEQADITSLLLRGKTTNELIASEGGSTFSPENALAQFAASSVQDDLRAATGLDILEMGFDDSGGGGVGDLNVTVGKKLTDRLILKYGTAASGEGQMIQTTSAEYQMTDNMTASGFQNTEGTFGGEIKYRLEFR